MFDVVYFNTKEKMMRCFNILIKDNKRYAHTFHLMEPIEDNRYYIYYIRKIQKKKKKLLTNDFYYGNMITEQNKHAK